MGKINIIGLGAGDANQLPMGVFEALKEAKHVFFRTKEHPVVSYLVKEGISFNSFDETYETSQDFDTVYESIAKHLLHEAKDKDILYAVPGHPMVAEDAVQLLLNNKEGIEVEILGGKSFLDDFFQAIGVDPIEGFQLVDGLLLRSDTIDLASHLVIMQVYNDYVAGEVKLHLLDQYPPEHQVARVSAAGSKKEVVEWVSLFELDHFEGVDNLLTVYVPPITLDEQVRSFETTKQYMDEIMERDLWALEQTHESLFGYLKEEAQEVEEAIQADDEENLIEELGDILLQVLYHAGVAEREGRFSLEDILETLNRKLRRRHPHVFDNYPVETIEDIDRMWQEIKAKEKGE